MVYSKNIETAKMLTENWQNIITDRRYIALVEGKMEQDFFGNVQTPFKLINNKVIVAGNEEVKQNPRSRSAKLRIAEKK